MNCKNCGHKIRKMNGTDIYQHTISPTGRSNNAISHYTDIACRCDKAEPINKIEENWK